MTLQLHVSLEYIQNMFNNTDSLQWIIVIKGAINHTGEAMFPRKLQFDMTQSAGYSPTVNANTVATAHIGDTQQGKNEVCK